MPFNWGPGRTISVKMPILSLKSRVSAADLIKMMLMKKKSLLAIAVCLLMSGALLLAQEMKQVAVVTVDMSQGESMVSVKFLGPVDESRPVVIESRDGKVRETRSVDHVYEGYILLSKRLQHDFLAGSRVFQ